MKKQEKKRKKQRGVFEKEPGSKVWWIRYADATGRIRREKAGTKGAAITLYSKRKTEALQGKKLPEQLRKRAVTFGEIAQDALEYSRQHKRTYRDDKCRMERLLGWFRHCPADSISPQEMEQRLSEGAREEGWAGATVNRYKALLSMTYRLAVRNGKVGDNPARLVASKRESNGRVRWLSPEEEKSLRTVIAEQFPEHMPELDFALNTGLRKSEQYGLTWEAVDWERRIVTIPRSKNGEVRHVPLNGAALAVLEEMHRRSDGSGAVFRNLAGEPLAGPRHWFDLAVLEAELADFTWHCLRHTFASRLVMAGVDLRTVQELLGHKTISMTVRYSHLAPGHQLAAVERLAESGRKDLQEAPTDTRTDTALPTRPKRAPAYLH
jgi:site-specific recombinase XerD